MKEKIKGFIFDLDGVLTSTSEYHYLAWKKIAEELGIPFDRRKNESLKGVSRRESLIILMGGKRLDNSTFEELLVRKNMYYLDYIKRITPGSLLPGALDILNSIKEWGGKSAVASVSKNTDEVLKKLFHRTISSYEKALKRYYFFPYHYQNSTNHENLYFYLENPFY